MIVVWVLIGLVVVLVIWMIATYNRLVSLRQQTMNAWSQIDVQLKRRYDLIPNLVETVKGYMKHEQDTLERVIQARNRAIAAQGVHEKAAAEVQVASALGGIFALSEAYPELRSNENMLHLQEELKGTENKIAFARQYYNDIVASYNTKIESFPDRILAGMASMKPRELFELDDAAERGPVKVQF
ncbi:MAG TPA: LemA family protein [Fimbriimonadaceae bacterium]|nr:LemA family protein [Fimbriimonadaceae bacterium]HRJ95134.1 LemA family protein [Fimbriimonadaceae bacterium]